MKNPHSSRIPLFQQFLQSRGLVGRSKEDLINDLGAGTTEEGILKYQLNRSNREASTRILQIAFDSHEKVEKWRIGTMAPEAHELKWYTSDVDPYQKAKHEQKSVATMSYKSYASSPPCKGKEGYPIGDYYFPIKK